MTESVFFASQLSTGTVLWDEHTQVGTMASDFSKLAPMSIAMGADLTPWLTWIEDNGMDDALRKNTSFFSLKAVDDVLGEALRPWARDWHMRIGHGPKQLAMFLKEWYYVISSPALQGYRKSPSGCFHLSSLGLRIHTGNENHLVAAQGPWAYETLRLARETDWIDPVYMAWAQLEHSQRVQLNEQWAYWHSLFPDQQAFLQYIARQGLAAEPVLDLPDGLLLESPK